MTEDRFDPAKDLANREKHGVPLAFGDRLFEDGDHVIVPSVREIDGEERFKVIGLAGAKLIHWRLRLAGRPTSLHLGEKEQYG